MKATFAAGCFWGVEETFRKVQGVTSTKVGYTDGETENPSYKEVCTDKTGHAEAIEIDFDPEKISYNELLDIFWQNHNPTTLNMQGPDVGSQYRSAIFYHSEKQKEKAIASKKRWQEKFDREIVTEIKPAKEFYKAEEYHQKYLQKKGLNKCG